MPESHPPPTASRTELDRKVEFLSDPASYPERPRAVERRETHMSWVFLTDTHAYKLKKPVRTSFLDFSTLELRRRFCEEEVRLNQRLAARVYLGVVPLGVEPGGRFRIGGGVPADWLVKMVRLPDQATLEHAIGAGSATAADIRRLALRLVAFYRDAARVEVTPADYRSRLLADIASNEQAVLQPGYGLPPDLIVEPAEALRRFVARHTEALDRRAGEGRIVEGHGDLRPEHIYLLDDIVVIDCLEFNPAFRTLDPVDELAYLAMECDHGGAPRIGPVLFETYAARSGDAPHPGLVAFYKGSRALLRAKIAIWHLDEPRPRDHEKWWPRAVSYLELARSYAAEL